MNFDATRKLAGFFSSVLLAHLIRSLFRRLTRCLLARRIRNVFRGGRKLIARHFRFTRSPHRHAQELTVECSANWRATERSKARRRPVREPLRRSRTPNWVLASNDGRKHGFRRAIAAQFPQRDYKHFADIGTAQGGLPAQVALLRSGLAPAEIFACSLAMIGYYPSARQSRGLG